MLVATAKEKIKQYWQYSLKNKRNRQVLPCGEQSDMSYAFQIAQSAISGQLGTELFGRLMSFFMLKIVQFSGAIKL